jgi:hypothetical protein
MSSRRKFITVLGGAAAAWPLAARAQQPERVRRIGMLMGFADPSAQSYVTAFRGARVGGRQQSPDRSSLGCW